VIYLALAVVVVRLVSSLVVPASLSSSPSPCHGNTLSCTPATAQPALVHVGIAAQVAVEQSPKPSYLLHATWMGQREPSSGGYPIRSSVIGRRRLAHPVAPHVRLAAPPALVVLASDVIPTGSRHAHSLMTLLVGLGAVCTRVVCTFGEGGREVWQSA
jgi:hypothetical protein